MSPASKMHLPARSAHPRPPSRCVVEWLESRTLLAAQVVSLKAIDPVANEATVKSATLAISRAGVLNFPLTVQLSTSGPAVPGTDFNFSANATPDPSSPGVYDLTIPAGASSVNVAVNPVPDAAADSVYFNFQTLTAQLQTSDPSVAVDPAAEIADVRIYDGDDAQPASNGYSFGLVNVLNGASSQIEPLATITDSVGDVYLAGTFSGTVNLNPTGTAVNYSSPGNASAFVAKYNPSGTLLWSKVYSGASDAWASSLALDNSGNVIIGGRFLGSVDFNPSGTPSDVLTTPTTQDSNFVVKLTAAGNLVWAQQIGGVAATSHGVASDPTSLPDRTPVATDSFGDVYVGGDFTGTATLPGTQQTFTSQGDYDMFVVKLSSAGSVTWAKSFGGTAADMLNGMFVDGTGQVYATGSFGSTVNFGSTPLTSNGVSAFALKLASDGTVDWAGAMGGSPNDSAEGNAILADSSGNVYLAGDFDGTIDFDPGPGVVSRSGPGGAVFVLKLTAAGAFGWVQTPTNSGDWGSIAWGLAQDSQGNLYTTGFFSGTLSLGSFGTLGASGQYDTFIAKYRQDTGDPLWGTKVDGTDGDLATGITADKSGNLYLAGNFSDAGGGGTANFDPFNHTAEESAAGSTAGFLWKLTGPAVVNAPPTVAAPAAANPNPATGTSTNLSVLGADDGGESNLTYTWATTGTPPAPVTFSINGNNAAKNTIASFTAAGTYSLQVTLTDSGGLSTTSNVSVTVNQTLTSINVTPAKATLNENGTQRFSASGLDQFGNPLTTQPAFTWSLAPGGIGMVDSTGLYTAPSAAGTATVKANSSSVAGTASVEVDNAAPTVATPAAANPNPVTATTTLLSVLGADDGGESNLTYTWATIGTPPAPVSFSINGTNASKTTTAMFSAAGSYNFQVTITDTGGLSVTSSVAITVNQTLTSIGVKPGMVTLNTNGTQLFSASALDQFGTALVSQPTFTWSLAPASVGTIDQTGMYTAPGSAGSATVQATSGSITGTASVAVKAAAVPVTVTAGTFEYANNPPDVSVTFSDDVSAGLSPSTLAVQNLTTGAMLSPSGLTYSHATNTAVFSFAGPLTDGNYRATLAAASATDAAGNHLAGDYTLPFFWLTGDINHDRSVGFADLVVLASHYGQSGNYAAGDLNGDGKVNFSDLVILAANYGHTLAPPPTAAALMPSTADDPLTILLRHPGARRPR